MPGLHPPAPLGRRVLAVAIGLFATWQLIYLPAANLIHFVPRRIHSPELDPFRNGYQVKGSFTTVEPLQWAAERGGDVLDFWSQASGQEQGWALFAPGLPPYTVTPAAEFRFADGTSETELSPYEPTDKLNPWPRPPLVNNRPFNFESQLCYQVMFAPPEAVEQFPDVYRNLPNEARLGRRQVSAWLAWRLKQYRAAHPDRPAPTEVILKHRFIATPRPGEPPEWTRVQERPFAKLKADHTFEAYDAVNKRFVPVEAMP